MGRANPFFIVLPVNPEGSTNDAPGVRALAEQALSALDQEKVTGEAVRFLEFVAAGKGIECGSKGHLLTWGYVSNYGNAERTVEALKPFWSGLWSLDDGPMDFETALVVSQDEEGQPLAVQVGHDEGLLQTKVSYLRVGLLGDR